MLRIFLGMALVAAAAPLAAQQVPIVLHAARMLVGTGGAMPVGDLRAMTAYAMSVEVSDPVYDYLLDIVDATRSDREIALGASPRAGVDLLRASRVNALLRWQPRGGDRRT